RATSSPGSGKSRHPRRVRWLPVVLAGCVVSVVTMASAEKWSLDRYVAGDRESGYLQLSEETRALQDDDFLNPGMFAVESGEALWNKVEGTKGFSCASCHEDAGETMRGVAARYPQYDGERDGIVNLELRINEMRTEYMEAEPYMYESPEMLALTTYVAHQSRGMPLAVDIEGPAKAFF